MEAEETDVPQDEEEEGVMSDRARFVQLVGLIINNTMNSYWLSASDTKNAIDECYAALEVLFESSGKEIMFSIVNDTVTVDEETVTYEDHLITVFVEHLKSCDINSFALKKGMPRDEFGKLIEILDARPDEIETLGGFASLLEQFELAHARSIAVRYERVTDQDAVVSKDKLGVDAMTDEEVAEKILEFLKDSESGGEQAAKILREAAANPDKMADLILEASGGTGEGEGGKGGGDGEGGGEGTGPAEAVQETKQEIEAVVANLQHTFETMMEDPAAQTPTGKKKLLTTIGKLEKEMVKKLTDVGRLESVKAVQEAVSVMRDELKMEALAAEYMKKRKAIMESEKRILRYMQAKGLDKVAETELEDKLAEAGLDGEGWNELLVKGGAPGAAGLPGVAGQGGLAGLGAVLGIPGMGTGPGGPGGAPGPGPDGPDGPGGPAAGGYGFTDLSMGQLATLLDHLEGKIREAEEGKTTVADVQDMTSTMEQVNKEMDTLLESTEQKLTALVGEVLTEGAEGDDELKEKQSRILTKRDVLRILAEIVQELFQPLSVVNCSIDMIVSKALGEITDSQVDMLKLAREGTTRIQVLIDDLNKISGLPETKTPDKKIMAFLYEDPDKKDK